MNRQSDADKAPEFAPGNPLGNVVQGLTDHVIGKLLEEGCFARFIPSSYIPEIRNEFENLNTRQLLEPEIHGLLKEFFQCGMKDLPFEPKSIILTASPCSITRVHFHLDNKKIPVVLPPTYFEFGIEPGRIENSLNSLLSGTEYQVKKAFDLPAKFIAAKCGLAEYGRNNLCYVHGLGSFALLSTFYSNIPCLDNDWGECRMMDQCEACNFCVCACPTQALTPERDLVKAELCVTYHNEFNDSQTFPEWMDPSSHNSIVGCMNCQLGCPANKDQLNKVLESIEFNEEETFLIMKGTNKDKLPKETLKKLEYLNISVYYEKLARNLGVLINRLLK